MSIHLMTEVWRRKIDIGPKMVLLKIADMIHDNGRGVWAGARYIANFSGLGERTVREYLKVFRKEGVLISVGPETGGRGKERVYTLSLPRLREKYPLLDHLQDNEKHAGAAGFSGEESMQELQGLEGNPADDSRNPADDSRNPAAHDTNTVNTNRDNQLRGAEAGAGKEAGPDPAKDGDGDSAPKGQRINAHWKACKDELAKLFWPNDDMVFHATVVEHDDGVNIVLSRQHEPAARAFKSHAREMARILGRRVFVVCLPHGSRKKRTSDQWRAHWAKHVLEYPADGLHDNGVAHG